MTHERTRHNRKATRNSSTPSLLQVRSPVDTSDREQSKALPKLPVPHLVDTAERLTAAIIADRKCNARAPLGPATRIECIKPAGHPDPHRSPCPFHVDCTLIWTGDIHWFSHRATQDLELESRDFEMTLKQTDDYYIEADNGWVTSICKTCGATLITHVSNQRTCATTLRQEHTQFHLNQAKRKGNYIDNSRK